MKYYLTGITFSMLWASASIAGKFGLLSVEPLLFFDIRFITAGIILLTITHVFRKERMPMGEEWKLGVCRRLGVGEPPAFWQRLLASATALSRC